MKVEDITPLKTKTGAKEWEREDLEIMIKTLRQGKVFYGCTENGNTELGICFSLAPSKNHIESLEDNLKKLA